ncbi:MAG TPA: DUF1569 domain-containing protein [Phycisphaerae bacterium]|nr:DUF1569 domain-containing protein [Phycisphaerae bacterium]HRW52775.1 DUF1569 domain-containing protein [Phycisphaerae bacterium]
MVNTKRVAQRRSLRFETIDDAIREADLLVEASRRGRLRQLGNWSAGQCLGHVAAWIEYGYDGYPMKPPGWLLRMLLAWLGKKYLRTGMPAGIRISGAANGTYGTEDAEIADAAERFKNAFLRLKRGDIAPHDSPAFGPMSHEDRIQLNLRHAELHLSFLDYDI